MHYVILITHQSDIKICTTKSFQACLLTSHTIRIPIASMCVRNENAAETLSDHISIFQSSSFVRL